MRPWRLDALGDTISQCHTYAEIPGRLGRALADGLSLEGAGEALSIGAAGLFLRSLTGNPMDVHMHTGVNLRRYLVQMDGLSRRNKLLSLLLWHTGPEVRSTQQRMEPTVQPDPEAVAALPYRTQEDLLDAIQREYIRPAAHRLVDGDESRAVTGGAGSQNHRPSRPAICALWLQCDRP